MSREEPAPVVVNGLPQPWQPGWTVASVLAERGGAGPGVAVEQNGAVVRRADHAQTPVNPGDRLEIVRLVGGG